MESLTQCELKKHLSYDPDTGLFTRLLTRGRHKSGTIAGYRNPQGYIAIIISRKRYSGHRLAWLYVTGDWPKECIDHIDMDKSNNRFSNLRGATYSQNSMNRGKTKAGTSGHKGVSWCKSAGKWHASITVNGRRSHLGSYDDLSEAAVAYKDAVNKYHGEFGRVD